MRAGIHNLAARHERPRSRTARRKSPCLTTCLKIIANDLGRFAAEHDWDQFHFPKNLAATLAVEYAIGCVRPLFADRRDKKVRVYLHQMSDIDFRSTDLPSPHHWVRRHDFGGRDYVTLSVFYVAERVSPQGERLPKRLRCVMFGTLLARQEESGAPDVESGQMLLDALFSKRFPAHQCRESCARGWSKSGGGATPFDERQIAHKFQ